MASSAYEEQIKKLKEFCKNHITTMEKAQLKVKNMAKHVLSDNKIKESHDKIVLAINVEIKKTQDALEKIEEINKKTTIQEKENALKEFNSKKFTLNAEIKSLEMRQAAGSEGDLWKLVKEREREMKKKVKEDIKPKSSMPLIPIVTGSSNLPPSISILLQGKSMENLSKAFTSLHASGPSASKSTQSVLYDKFFIKQRVASKMFPTVSIVGDADDFKKACEFLSDRINNDSEGHFNFKAKSENGKFSIEREVRGEKHGFEISHQPTEGKMNITASSLNPADESLFLMVNAVKDLGKTTFNIDNCENDPITALKLFVMGKSLGLDPQLPEDVKNQITNATEKNKYQGWDLNKIYEKAKSEKPEEIQKHLKDFTIKTTEKPELPLSNPPKPPPKPNTP